MIFWRPPWPHRIKADQVEVLGNGLIGGQAGNELRFQIKSQLQANQTHFNATSCQVTFEGPSKPEIQFQTSNNNCVNCSWLPKLPGVYKIIVKYNNEQVPGSPFTCEITGSLSGMQLQEEQRKKIVCTGTGLQFGKIDLPNEVRVNEVNGMIGGLRVSMEGPGKPVINFRTNPEDGSLSMYYQVPNTGNYTMNIRFMDKHVPGSPFKIKVT